MRNVRGVGGALLLAMSMVAACGGDASGSSSSSDGSNTPPADPCANKSGPPGCVKNLMIQSACSQRGYCFGCSTAGTPPATCARQLDLTTGNGIELSCCVKR